MYLNVPRCLQYSKLFVYQRVAIKQGPQVTFVEITPTCLLLRRALKKKTEICLRLGVKNEECIEMWYQGAFAYFVKYDGTRENWI